MAHPIWDIPYGISHMGHPTWDIVLHMPAQRAGFAPSGMLCGLVCCIPWCKIAVTSYKHAQKLLAGCSRLGFLWISDGDAKKLTSFNVEPSSEGWRKHVEEAWQFLVIKKIAIIA